MWVREIGFLDLSPLYRSLFERMILVGFRSVCGVFFYVGVRVEMVVSDVPLESEGGNGSTIVPSEGGRRSSHSFFWFIL